MSDKTFKFTEVKECVDNEYACVKLKGDYALLFYITSNSMAGYHIGLQDTITKKVLFSYVKWCPNKIIRMEHISYDNSLTPYEHSNDYHPVNNDRILLTSLYLGAYKNPGNSSTIDEELINMTYELLTTIHKGQGFKLEGSIVTNG